VNSSAAAFFVIFCLAVVAFQIWFLVIAVRFLRTGRMAFVRYVEDSDIARLHESTRTSLSSEFRVPPEPQPIHRSPGTGV
jgi:hypothetical protein